MVEIALFAIFVSVSVMSLAYALIARREAAGDTVARRLNDDGSYAVSSAMHNHDPFHQATQSVRTIARRLKPFLTKLAGPVSLEEIAKLKAKLVHAGFRHESGALIFMGTRSVLGLGMAALPLLFVWHTDLKLGAIGLLCAFSGGVAFWLPGVWLNRKTTARAESLKRGLSDTLDLLVIMVESGMGLDGAIHRVSIEMAPTYPELAEELRITNMETHMGIQRAQALENLAARTGVREIQTLVASLVQAERFGAGVAKTLREQARTIRRKRKQAAEEAAQKTAVKLLIPLILFIFPALMVVLGGPAVMNLLESFNQLQ